MALLEFDRTRKSMGVIVRTRTGNNKLLVKVGVSYYILSMDFYMHIGYTGIKIRYKNHGSNF